MSLFGEHRTSCSRTWCTSNDAWTLRLAENTMTTILQRLLQSWEGNGFSTFNQYFLEFKFQQIEINSDFPCNETMPQTKRYSPRYFYFVRGANLVLRHLSSKSNHWTNQQKNPFIVKSHNCKQHFIRRWYLKMSKLQHFFFDV